MIFRPVAQGNRWMRQVDFTGIAGVPPARIATKIHSMPSSTRANALVAGGTPAVPVKTLNCSALCRSTVP
jgi:hypothetical protein